jgi:hypothetical protein
MFINNCIHLIVAFALANCLRGQPLKTTLGLCCCPAGYQHGAVFLICSVEIYCNPDIITVPLPIAENMYTLCLYV